MVKFMLYEFYANNNKDNKQEIEQKQILVRDEKTERFDKTER